MLNVLSQNNRSILYLFNILNCVTAEELFEVDESVPALLTFHAWINTAFKGISAVCELII
jgi:hypothetical protein